MSVFLASLCGPWLKRSVILASVLALGCAGSQRVSPPEEPPSELAREVSPERSSSASTLKPSSPPEPPGPEAEPKLATVTGKIPAATFTHPVVDAHRTRAVVLLYHGFDRGSDPLSVSSSNFKQQMQWLKDNRVEVVHLSQLVSFLRGELLLPERVAVVSMDDGMSSVYHRAWPILKQLELPFSLGITTGLVEDQKRFTMSWDQVRELYDSGLVEIASHGHRHRGLANLPRRLVDEELRTSRSLLEQRVGVSPNVYFYPLGSMDRRARELVGEAGYDAAFTATGAPIALGTSHLGEVPRTSVFYSDSMARFSYFFRGFLRTIPHHLLPKPAPPE
ncbi:MAG: polysaccharide deacetylase family protein [Polyangiaceae bacterium]